MPLVEAPFPFQEIQPPASGLPLPPNVVVPITQTGVPSCTNEAGLVAGAAAPVATKAPSDICGTFTWIETIWMPAAVGTCRRLFAGSTPIRFT